MVGKCPTVTGGGKSTLAEFLKQSVRGESVRRGLRYWRAALGVGLALAGSGASQNRSPAGGGADAGAPPATSADNFTIKVRVAEVMVPFTVRDGKKIVEDVGAQEVSVTDDGAPADNIAYFGRLGALPLRLGFLIDSSDSIIQRSHFEEQAASSFAHKLLKPETDRAFVVEFTSHKPLLQEETSDLRRLDAAIAALDPLGRTPLFDAVYSACHMLAEKSRESERVARVLVAISDGDDNSSRVTLAQAIAAAQNAQILVFSISTKGSRGLIRRRSRGDAALIRLAEETGGRAFFADTVEQLGKTLAMLEKEMRNRYVLFYRPPGAREDGLQHRIEVSVRRGGKQLRVRGRTSYYTGVTGRAD